MSNCEIVLYQWKFFRDSPFVVDKVAKMSNFQAIIGQTKIECGQFPKSDGIGNGAQIWMEIPVEIVHSKQDTAAKRRSPELFVMVGRIMLMAKFRGTQSLRP